MHLFKLILSSVAFVHSLSPLSRDFATNVENTHYKYGYQWTRHPQLRITSAFSLQRLAREEREIYNEIRTLLNHKSSRTQVSQYVKDYEETALALAEDFECEKFIGAVAGNLVSVYRMVRRFRNFIQVWASQRHGGAINDDKLKHLRKVYNADKVPRRIDFHISMFAFPLLQFQSDIKADQACQKPKILSLANEF